ncbi:MAG: hypothetical protein ACJ79S_06590 [Gemmatimonadaceae bacterium]
MSTRNTALRLATALAVAAAAARSAGAQAWNHPSFQQPTVVGREFNFGVADGGNAGTSFLFQWREGISPVNQLSLDVGLADPDCFGCDSEFLLGGQFAHQLARANAQMPFDFLLTAGLNGAFGNDNTVLRVPVGVSVGHRFPLQGGMAITPYVHPRVSIDYCSQCIDDSGDKGKSDVNLNFDLGANFELTPQFALRASLKLGGSNDLFFDDDALGISLAWTPPGLRR